MDLLGTKITTLCLMFAIILLFFLLPIAVGKSILKKGAKGQFVLDCITCFGGGVFLGIFMLHMTPEIRELLEESLLEPRGIEYPVPEAIAGGGFFMILFLEKLINFVKTRGVNKEGDINVKLPNGVRNPAYQSHGNIEANISTDTKGGLENDNVVPMTVEQGQDSTSEQNTAMRARTAIMLVALSMDCIFEGMSLGLKYTTVAVWNMFAGIIGHEFIISFCLGMEFVKTQPTRWVVLCAFIYALTPVIGTAIGIAVFQTQADSDSVDLINGCLQSVAAGVFLYCTFIGVLSHHISHGAKLVLIVCTFLGFGLMAGLAAIPEGDDEPPEAETTSGYVTLIP